MNSSPIEREFPDYLLDLCFGSLDPPIARLPHCILPADERSVRTVAEVTGTAPGIWGECPPVCNQQSRVSSTGAVPPSFRTWEDPQNQEYVFIRGGYAKLGQATMLIDSRIPNDVLERMSSEIEVERYHLSNYYDMIAWVPEWITDLNWAYIPLTDETRFAIFVVATTRGHLVDKLQLVCAERGIEAFCLALKGRQSDGDLTTCLDEPQSSGCATNGTPVAKQWNASPAYSEELISRDIQGYQKALEIAGADVYLGADEITIEVTSDETLKAVASCVCSLDTRVRLVLYGDLTCDTLGHVEGLDCVETLVLGITDRNSYALSSILLLPNLKSLELAEMSVSKQELEQIAKLTRLEHLSLFFDEFDDSQDVLRCIERMRSLQSLDIDGLPLNNAALEQLVRIDHLRHIVVDGESIKESSE